MLALLWQIGDKLFSFSSAKLVVMQDNWLKIQSINKGYFHSNFYGENPIPLTWTQWILKLNSLVFTESFIPAGVMSR